jgi:AcrR family transcriptional regulator
MARKYEQRKRAQQQAETRERIVRAAIELHGTVGPAQTSLSAVADKAGVQRNTLYRHFPDERSLLLACSGLHTAEHPMPDPTPWKEIDDPVRRVRTALGEIYAHWEADEAMTARVVRDAEVSELVHEVSTLRSGEPLAAITDALVTAWPHGRRRKQLVAAVELAIAFRTWQSLVRRSGLTSDAAADLMTTAVAGAARS